MTLMGEVRQMEAKLSTFCVSSKNEVSGLPSPIHPGRFCVTDYESVVFCRSIPSTAKACLHLAFPIVQFLRVLAVQKIRETFLEEQEKLLHRTGISPSTFSLFGTQWVESSS